MIDIADIRAAARAVAGDVVALSKAQLDELLDEVELGQSAQRTLRFNDAAVQLLGIDRVSDAN